MNKHKLEENEMEKDETTPLFILAPRDHGEPGPLESAVHRELTAKISAGIIDEEIYAGQITQALTLAREADDSIGVGRPSGRAQMHDTLHRLLLDLPQPEVQSSSDLDRVLEVVQGLHD
ncbi:hypothetical protein [Schaalia sp. ZJ1691]|uniref:hypothetical protein n=1 Tax=Schaalia sp. ZJ1691 TaxID=2709404 RepID=UPI0013ED8647|nr:hypothetical protein [Schaalia sp. ZJ1691]